MPTLLLRVVEALAQKTGWAISVMLGGPHPAKNGDIEVTSYVPPFPSCFSVPPIQSPLLLLFLGFTWDRPH